MHTSYKIIDDQVITYHKTVFYRFKISECDIIEDVCKEVLSKWAISTEGKFIIENSVEPIGIEKYCDVSRFHWNYAIIATLESKKFTEYLLKFEKYHDQTKN